jgi:hypothetical protein
MRNNSLSRLCPALGVDCVEDSAADLPLPFPYPGNQLADFLVVIVFISGVIEHPAHHFVLPGSEFYRPSHACLPPQQTARRLYRRLVDNNLVAPLPHGTRMQPHRASNVGNYILHTARAEAELVVDR